MNCSYTIIVTEEKEVKLLTIRIITYSITLLLNKTTYNEKNINVVRLSSKSENIRKMEK